MGRVEVGRAEEDTQQDRVGGADDDDLRGEAPAPVEELVAPLVRGPPLQARDDLSHGGPPIRHLEEPEAEEVEAEEQEEQDLQRPAEERGPPGQHQLQGLGQQHEDVEGPQGEGPHPGELGPPRVLLRVQAVVVHAGEDHHQLERRVQQPAVPLVGAVDGDAGARVVTCHLIVKPPAKLRDRAAPVLYGELDPGALQKVRELRRHALQDGLLREVLPVDHADHRHRVLLRGLPLESAQLGPRGLVVHDDNHGAAPADAGLDVVPGEVGLVVGAE
mmetsp:Transcript_28227/g.79770  ORF Transcript_28227/g.79770 Transcript_28227/m.79770 type:complete len:274 (-) Transcript_28227:183-1004(-)